MKMTVFCDFLEDRIWFSSSNSGQGLVLPAVFPPEKWASSQKAQFISSCGSAVLMRSEESPNSTVIAGSEDSFLFALR